MLKWMNITACSEPCTIRMGDPVFRQEAWFITKECTGTRLILHNTSLANCLVNSMLKKLRPVVRGVTLQWSRGVPMDPKEYSVAAISRLLQPYHPAFSDIRLIESKKNKIKKKRASRCMAIALGSLWISPLTINGRTLNINYFPHDL